jgi:tetratricopeptide (TPR) repeat protein
LKLALQVVLLTNNKNFKLDEITRAIESIVQSENYVLPKKSVYLSIRQTAYDDIEQALKRYSDLKQASPTLYDFDNNNALIRIGYKLIEQKKYHSAIEIFKLSTREFPNHANAFDSLAEAYYLKGDLERALSNYQISVKLNPKNELGVRQISKIKALL